MADHIDDSILRFGDPLGFRIRKGSAGALRNDDAVVRSFRVEARTASKQQKEGVLGEGRDGSIWRLTADESGAMNGDDIAPFPLAYFVAGIGADVSSRVAAAAARRKLRFDRLEMAMAYVFGSTGSLIRSTAAASLESVELDVALSGPLNTDDARAVLAEALRASPAVAFLREPIADNTFALYANGRRRPVSKRRASLAPDTLDPFLVHRHPPRPDVQESPPPLLAKLGHVEALDVSSNGMAADGRRLFTIAGRGFARGNGRFECETWVALPGMSRFRIQSDEAVHSAAPSGLGLLSAGIAFCYLTQVHRYIEAQKLPIRRPRIVQNTTFGMRTGGGALGIDTHLFLSGNAPDEVYENLLDVSARTCFLHAAAEGSLVPRVSLRINGSKVEV